MNLQQRIDLLVKTGKYMEENGEEWQAAKRKAYLENNWFIADFVDAAAQNISQRFLQREILTQFARQHSLPETMNNPAKVGLVLAGNIPLVGFHDVMCVFLTGHIAMIKASSRDEALLSHLLSKMAEWNSASEEFLVLSERLKGCDAYIATGSDNTARYFEYYFRNQPHIIRKNRTSVAVITGSETPEELEKLADDVHLYFGLGCRNVTKIFVPRGYDFIPLINAFKKYRHLEDHNKYKNNYDYHLAVHLLNSRMYMSSGSLLLVEDAAIFSPISQLNYEFYDDMEEVRRKTDTDAVQCVVGKEFVNFGKAQCPNIDNFADGVNTVEFLKELIKD